MYLYAWKAGLKTTYYLRSRPATRIQQTTTSVIDAVVDTVLIETVPVDATVSDAEALACSLENPETCEACQ